MEKKKYLVVVFVLLAAVFILTAMVSTKDNDARQNQEIQVYLKSIASSLEGIESQLEKLNSRSLNNISSEMDEQGRAMGKIADELRYIRDAIK